MTIAPKLDIVEQLRDWKETDGMSDDARRKIWLMRKAADMIERGERAFTSLVAAVESESYEVMHDISDGTYSVRPIPYIDPMLNAACNRQPPDPPDVVDRLRETAAPHADPDGISSKYAVMLEAADEIERLRKLIDGRDDFIVSKGLFEEFAGQLEPR
jgi:hypothetical protein